MQGKFIRKYWVIGLLVGLLVGGMVSGTAVTVLAQDESGSDAVATPVGNEVSDDEVNAVAKDLYCPVCENTPLDVCGTQACADWRELIRTKLAAGESPQDIFNYFARQYGDGVLAAPPRQGINLLLWLFPIVAVVLGLVFFARYLQGLRAAQGAAPATADPLPVADEPADDYAARVEQELRRGS